MRYHTLTNVFNGSILEYRIIILEDCMKALIEYVRQAYAIRLNDSQLA